MNKKQLYATVYLSIWFLLPLPFLGFYIYQSGDLIQRAYEGNPPYWLEAVIEWIYPRFLTERHRFSLDFFQSKGNQVVFRAILLWYAGGVLLALPKPYWSRWYSFWSQKVDKRHVSRLIGLFILFVALFTWDLPLALGKLAEQAELYEPVFLLKLMGLPFPTKPIAYVLVVIFWLALLGAALPRYYGTISLAVAAGLFVILQGYLNSFHKLDHTYATFTYALCLLPFLHYEQQQAPDNWQQADWALRLIQLSIAITYFLAGLEKLLIGGWGWFAAENLIVHLRAHAAPLGLFVAQYPWLCFMLNVGAVVLELAFIFILVLPQQFRYLLLAFGILFHLGTFLLLGIGGMISPWMAVYIFFLPSFFKLK